MVDLGVDGLHGANAVVIQEDGKIVVGGRRYDENGVGDFALMRLEPDGDVDEDFGDDGLVLGGVTGAANAVAADEDGNVVVVGFLGRYLEAHAVIARYEA